MKKLTNSELKNVKGGIAFCALGLPISGSGCSLCMYSTLGGGGSAYSGGSSCGGGGGGTQYGYSSSPDPLPTYVPPGK